MLSQGAYQAGLFRAGTLSPGRCALLSACSPFGVSHDRVKFSTMKRRLFSGKIQDRAELSFRPALSVLKW